MRIHLTRAVPVACLSFCLLLVCIPGAAAIGGDQGWISIVCNVNGASVYFDGEYKGMTEGGSLTVPVYTTGTPYSTASVEKSGYTPYTSAITMPGNGGTTTVYATLNPIPTPTPEVYGSISVSSQPSGAYIYFNGNYRGTAPLLITEVWPGSYTIRAEKSGYASYTTTVQVSSGTRSSVYCPLSALDTTGALYVISTPSRSNVYLDGAYKGITPITLNGLAATTHVLELDHSGYYDWKSSVDVPAGGTKTIEASLNPMSASTTGWLYITSSPGGADVTLDGTAMGRTPSSGALKLNGVAAGSHTVVLTSAGYQQYSTTATVTPNTVTEVSAVLTPSGTPAGTGGLAVSSTPAGANVFLDNVFIGISPLTMTSVAAGNHVVSIKLEGYQEYSVTTPVNTGAESTVSASLVPAVPVTPKKTPLNPAVLLLALTGAVVILAARRH